MKYILATFNDYDEKTFSGEFTDWNELEEKMGKLRHNEEQQKGKKELEQILTDEHEDN